MGWFKKSLRADDISFEISGGITTHTVKWVDIANLSAEKIDKVTYDEIFLVVKSVSGEEFSIGELDQGFENFEKLLRFHVGLNDNWREKFELMEPGTREEIWKR